MASTTQAPFVLEMEVKDFKASRRKLLRLQRLIRGAISSSISYEVTMLVGQMKQGIRDQAPGGQRFAPLAASTIKGKNSSKALIHHSDLIHSIHREKFHQQNYEVSYFVGVNKQARGKKSRKIMWNIAEIHEFGVDPFIGMSMFGNPYQHPGIPARPFLRPTFNVWKSDLKKRLVSRIKNRLKI